jgi:hypothetical protein
MSVGTALPVLEPLDIKCTNSDCENGLHCFLQKTVRTTGRRWGPCRECGADLIDFPRVQARSIGDAKHLFKSLSHEWIRHVLWHLPFDQRAINHAKRKGRRRLVQVEVVKRLRTSVGKPKHPREGRQTPFQGNVLYYAQHAVAACCRKCIEYWHGIPMNTALKPEHLRYLAALVVQYLDRRLPDLNEESVKVPFIRQAKPVATVPVTVPAKRRTAARKARNG